MTLRSQYFCLALASLALLIYFPVITGEIIWIDDVELLTSLGSSPKLDLMSLFIPNAAGGLYYRPVTIASYILNWKLMWQATEWMHVVNILVHAGSAALCYGLLLKMTSSSRRLSAIGSLLFLVHPLATESVCWISGRTDLLAGFFLLGATWFVLSYRETGAVKWLIPALLLFLLAVLSKEFALAFVPGMLLIMYNKDLQATRQTVIRTAVYGSLVVGLFFLLRSFAFSSSVKSIKYTLAILNADYAHTVQFFLQTTVFYLKKIIFPYPLNFVIEELHYIYALLAWPVFLLILVAASRFNLASALFSSSLFLMAPSLLIAFGQIAWTPFAERYAYISSAFLIMSGIVWISGDTKRSSNKLLLGALCTVVVVFGVCSFQRSRVWKTSVALVESTLQQNPDNKTLLIALGEAYLEDRQFVKSTGYLKRAESLMSLDYDAKAGILLAKIDYYNNQPDLALMKIDDVIQRSKCKSSMALETKQLFLAQLVNKSAGSEKREYLAEKVRVYKSLFKLTKAPKYLYLMGTHTAALGDVKQARHYFVSASKMVLLTDPLHQMIQQRLRSLPASGAGA